MEPHVFTNEDNMINNLNYVATTTRQSDHVALPFKYCCYTTDSSRELKFNYSPGE